MKVILREEVAKLGKAGEAVTVRDGFARNFLVPRGLAYVATEGALRKIEHRANGVVLLDDALVEAIGALVGQR